MNKIKLQYIWVDLYKGLNNFECNFTSKYSFSYDKESGNLTCKENKDYIDDFFGKMFDVTAIVGKNGTGKTTILNCILEEAGEWIMIYVSEKGEFFYRQFGMKKCNFEELEIKEIESSKPLTIMLSFVFEKYERIGKKIDISTSRLVEGILDNETDENPYVNPLHEYFYYEFERQIYFIINNGNFADKLEVPLPDKCKIEYDGKEAAVLLWEEHFSREIYLPECPDLSLKEKIEKTAERLTDIIRNKESKGITAEDICYNVLLDMMLRINNAVNEETKDEYEAILEAINDDVSTDIFNVIESINIQGIDLSAYTNMLEYVQSHKDFLNKWATIFTKIHLPLTSQGEEIDTKTFFNLYRNTHPYKDYLKFSWGYNMSSGENAMLNLFSRIYSAKEAIEKNDNITLLIDEADLMFHPEWQRQYIHKMRNFFETIFPQVNVQIILATHSPIMLSDIPKQNVVYLDKTDAGRIFACNRDEKTIHSVQIFSHCIRILFFLIKVQWASLPRSKLKVL